MKVVLLKDIPRVGQKTDVKDVSDGYALNFLIPKGLAVAGTPREIDSAARQKSEQAAEHRIQADLLLKNLSSIEGVRIEMSGKASDKGHLFASIHADAIAAELRTQKGIAVPPESLLMDKPIKNIGEHEISVRVQEKTASFTLVVTAA